MWETDWASQTISEDGAARAESRVDAGTVASVYLLHWQEHCLECAVPECYDTCPLYVERADRKCARFRHGIVPNRRYGGLHGYGADVWFRRWGKLESRLWFGAATPRALRRLTRLDRFLSRGLVGPTATLLRRLSPERRLSRGYALARNLMLRRLSRRPNGADLAFDTFLVEVWNPSETRFNLIIECFQNDSGGNRGDVRFRETLPLEPGHNLHRIPVARMNLDLERSDGRILVYPENDAEVRVIFTWLDFVRQVPPREAAAPAPKIKCVVWDLDHTLWSGILIEDGPEGVRLQPEALELVRRLDERGVIQSIASKNDHALAWSRITDLGLQDYFLYPAINWGPKSENIKQIAEALNINVDTFGFIDDSAFERGEVGSRLPQVRCYDATEIPSLPARPEFDVPVTADSRRRRATYLAEAQRKQIAQRFGDDYDEFLRSCEMEATIFVPEAPEHVERCLELLQRSNQLNLSTHRYQKPEFLACLEDAEMLCIATRCRDRFGEYGTVGFASIRLDEGVPLLIDYVLSCRVAQKRVEHAWFSWLQGVLCERGYDRIRATFIPTDRNGVLWRVLGEVGFTEVERLQTGQVLELPVAHPPPGGDIVTVRGSASRVPA